MPRTLKELNEWGATRLDAATIENPSACGPFGAAWLELAANVLLRFDVIEPLLLAGTTVIQDSFGYKHLLKHLLTTTSLADSWTRESQMAREFLRRFFGVFLRPDLGIHVAGSAELALKWKHEAGVIPTAFESLLVAGQPAGPSFVDLQNTCAREFASFADEYNWTTIAVSDDSRGPNRRAAFDRLAQTALGGCWLDKMES